MFAHSGCKLCSFYSHRYLDWIGYTLTIPLDCVRNRYPYSLDFMLVLFMFVAKCETWNPYIFDNNILKLIDDCKYLLIHKTELLFMAAH